MRFQLTLPMVMKNTYRAILTELFGSRWDPETKRQFIYFRSIGFSREVLQAQRSWLLQAMEEQSKRDPSTPWKATFGYTCHVRYIACSALRYAILHNDWPVGFDLDSEMLDGWKPE